MRNAYPLHPIHRLRTSHPLVVAQTRLMRYEMEMEMEMVMAMVMAVAMMTEMVMVMVSAIRYIGLGFRD